MSDGLLLCALIGAVVLWLQERTWRKQVQRERQWWMDSAFKASRMVDDAQEINWELLSQVRDQRAEGRELRCVYW